MSDSQSNQEKKGFVAKVLAFLKGDEDKAIATKNKKMATSAIDAQHAVLRGAEVTQENDLETAKEAFEKAVYPTKLITDQNDYLKSVRLAHERVIEAEEKLEETRKSLAFLEDLKKDF